MSNLFKNPVFIKPWGLMVNPDTISPIIGFFCTTANSYEIVYPEDRYSSADIGIRVVQSHVFAADVVMDKMILNMRAGAESFNDFTLLSAMQMVTGNDDMDEDEEDEDDAPKKRGRKARLSDDEIEAREAAAAKREEEREAAMEERATLFINEQAVTFNLYEIRSAHATLDFMSAKPTKFKIAQAKNPEKMQERLAAKLAKLHKMAEEYCRILNLLQSPDQNSVASTIGKQFTSLEDDSVEEIDARGLASYEAGQRTKLTELQEAMNGEYEQLESAIITWANAQMSAGSRSPFEMPIQMGDELITLKTLYDLLTTQCLVELDNTEKGALRIPSVLNKLDD